MNKLGENIKAKRLQLNLTQEELANKLGYKSRSSINKIELGINDISQRQIASFAKALNTTPAFLLGLEDEDLKTYITINNKGQKKDYYISEAQLQIILSMLNEFTKENK